MLTQCTYILSVTIDWTMCVAGFLANWFGGKYFLGGGINLVYTLSVTIDWTMCVAGFLANRFGGKYFFGGGILLTAILTLLTPVFTTWSIYLLISARVFEGIFEVSPFSHLCQGL